MARNCGHAPADVAANETKKRVTQDIKLKRLNYFLLFFHFFVLLLIFFVLYFFVFLCFSVSVAIGNLNNLKLKKTHSCST